MKIIIGDIAKNDSLADVIRAVPHGFKSRDQFEHIVSLMLHLKINMRASIDKIADIGDLD